MLAPNSTLSRSNTHKLQAALKPDNTYHMISKNSPAPDIPPGCSMSPGWVLPYLGMVGRFRGDDFSFMDFQSDLFAILCIITI